MKKSKGKRKGNGKLQLAVAATVIVAGYFLLPADSQWKQKSTWQQMASPGGLSSVHAYLEDDCAACHTPVTGVDATKCSLCHAANQHLLQRQPTAFHSDIGSCQQCHPEHQGLAQRPTIMEHEAIARIGLDFLDDQTDLERSTLHSYLQSWAEADRILAPGMQVTRLEATLACERCHANQDRHFGLMGKDCSQCHATQTWSLPRFQHPTPQSKDCAQCHQAPPSHYMGHYKMISATVAQKPKATVDQCYECHRTTAWTDIPGIGHYKHH